MDSRPKVWFVEVYKPKKTKVERIQPGEISCGQKKWRSEDGALAGKFWAAHDFGRN